MNPLSSSLRLRGGFSLIELLVATAITSVLVVFLASILGRASDEWRRGSSEYTKGVDAQVALDLLAEDLRGIVVKDGEAEWLQVKPVTIEGLEQQVWLMFLSRPDGGATSGKGDVCAVSYRIERKDPLGGNEPLYALYRCVLSPEETFNYVGASDLYEEIWKDRADEATEPSRFLAAHVAGLELVFELETAGGHSSFLAPNVSLRCARDIESSETVPDGAVLKAVSAEMTIIGPEGDELLSARQTSVEDVFTRFGRTFSTGIKFPTLTNR